MQLPKFPDLSLYDLFGYLIPGMVTLAAISLLYWRLFVPEYIFAPSEIDVNVWIYIIIASYILGHIVETLARRCPCYLFIADYEIDKIPDDIVKVAAERLFKRMDLSKDFQDKLTEKIMPCRKGWKLMFDKFIECINICLFNGKEETDEKTNRRELVKLFNRALTQNGNVAARDIYMHKEGFCRGMSVALFLFSIPLVIYSFFVTPQPSERNI